MALNVGDLYSRIVVDTSSVARAERQSMKFSANAVKQFEKVEGAAEKMAGSYVDASGRLIGANDRFARSTRESVRSAEKFTQKMAKAEAKMTAFGKSALRTGKWLSIGLTLPLVAMGNQFANMASDLAETQSKTDAIFGQSSESVKEWSKTAATSYGLAQKEALDFAAQAGGALKEIGRISERESARVATDLVGLAADLNSFFNREDAGTAIASALTGEFEPLKKFNVIINDAALKQEALNLKIWEGSGVLTAQQKQLATLALLQKQTSDAQGDFSRTSEGLANQSRILEAEFKNQAAAIGKDLLPFKLELIKAARSALSAFKGLSPEMRRTVVVVGALVAILGPTLIALGTFIMLTKKAMIVIGLGKAILWLSKTMGVLKVATLAMTKTLVAAMLPIIALVAAFTAVGAAIVWMSNEFEQVKAWGDNISFVEKATRLMHAAFLAAKVGAFAVLTGLAELVRYAFVFERNVRSVVGRLLNWIKDKVFSALEKINDLLTGFVNNALNALEALGKVVGLEIEVPELKGLELPDFKFDEGAVRQGEKIAIGVSEGFAKEAAKAAVDMRKALNGELEKPEMLQTLTNWMSFQDPRFKEDLQDQLKDLSKGFGGMDMKNLVNNTELNEILGSGTLGKMKERIEELKRDFESLQGDVMRGALDEGLADSFSDLYANRIAAEEEHYAESLQKLEAAEALKLESVKPYHILREEMERQHQKRLRDLEMERLDKTLSGYQSFFGNLAQLSSVESKKAQRVAKAAAIAEATINTYRSAVSAFAFGSRVGGPVLGAVFSAGAIAAGFANIAKIRSAKATGGEVFAGGSYRVNENGPEMLSTSQGDFLMMGNEGGSVTSHEKLRKMMQGGMGSSGDMAPQTNVFVEVMNYGEAQVEIEETTEDEEKRIKVIIDRTKDSINADILRGTGEIPGSLESKYGLNRAG